jgi:cytidine deaminase
MTVNLQSEQIHHQIKQHGGYLPVDIVQELLAKNDMTIDQLLVALMSIIKESAIMPISHFKVGAAVVGATGNIYTGANQEYLSLPLSQAIHAEQSALAMAHLHGETEITKLIASEKPCGHCRQFYYELANGGSLDVVMPDGKIETLSHLLPHAFGPKELGLAGGLLSAASQSLKLKLSSDEELVTQALQAAEKSYAPYSKSYCGAALRARDGKIYRGSYLENAVFNPSLPALQAAFVHVIQSGTSFADITEAVIVQCEDGAVNHVAMSEVTLKAVCGAASLQIFAASRR